MTPGAQIILSGTLTFGVPLALAVRDLIALRRGPSGGNWGPEPPQPVFPKPTDGNGTMRKPLPACLLEAARGAPGRATIRDLELV